MTLENILLALKHSMKNELEKLEENLLQNDKVKNILTTFFAEEQVRPELVAQIRAPSLMYEYLNLDLEEREEFERFRKASKDYLLGGGEVELQLKTIESEKVASIIRMQRYAEQLLKIFEFYLENREEFEIFTPNYIRKNKKVRAKFRNMGGKILHNSFRNLKDRGGVHKIFELETEINPEIKRYTSYRELFKIDSIPKLLQLFDFYLDNRKEYEIFNYSYLRRNKNLTKKFGILARRIVEGANRNLSDNGKSGLEILLEMAKKVRPEIVNYISPKRLFEFDAPRQLAEIFDFYIEEREKDNRKKNKELAGITFHASYLKTNKRVQKRFNGLASRIYVNSHWFFKNNGKFEHLLDMAYKLRPEIKRYADRVSLREIEDTKLFIRMFDFYLKHRTEEQTFNRYYFQSNERLKKEFGNAGSNLVQRSDKWNFKDKGGINYLVEVAAKECPEILEYWAHQKHEINLIDNIETEGPRNLIRIFDFFLKNKRKGEVFNLQYIRNNKKQIKRFGTLGQRIYTTARNHFSDEGGVGYFVQLVAQQRPEILQHWQYAPRNKRNGGNLENELPRPKGRGIK